MSELLSVEFTNILDDQSSTERDVHKFLKQYPGIIIALFNVSWNWYGILSEFKLGADYRADFLAVSADSGRWHVVFIELEGPHDQIYLKDGQAAKKLRVAQKQTADWQKYFQAHKQTIKHELSKWLQSMDVCAQNMLMGTGGGAHNEIMLPNVFLHDQYKIMIGRRSSFGSNTEHHMPGPGAGYWPSVSTYDRIIDYLKGREKQIEQYDHMGDLRKELSFHDKFGRWACP